MSPLIATVLLMAFAVALGGMIMNYTSDLDAGGGEDCKKVDLQTSQFCYDGEKIQVSTRNKGEVVVGGLALLISTPDAGSFTIDIPDSRLAEGGSVSKAVPFSVDDSTGVSLMAAVESNGGLFECNEPSLSKKPLPSC
jgi:hypothetical protein